MKADGMLLKADNALTLGERMDLFDSPFVHPAFVDAADGRICAGPVTSLSQGGYHFVYEAARSLPALGARSATLWAHGYGPNGGCFLDLGGIASRNEQDFRQGLDRLAEQSEADFLIWPYFPLECQEYKWLCTWLSERVTGGNRPDPVADGAARMLVRRRHSRAFLDCRLEANASRIPPDTTTGLKLSRNKRKTLGRQSRRLQDLGDVRFISTRDGLDHRWAMEAFLKVEASGWKARKGTALSVNPALHDFVDDFLPDLLSEGRARIDLMMLDHDCIAGLVSLQAGRGLFAWKTGMDEVYKRFSPGVHILLEVSQQAVNDPDIDYVDSLADAGHPVAEHIWGGRRAYGQLLLPLNARGWVAALSYSSASFAKQQARYWAKKALGRS